MNDPVFNGQVPNGASNGSASDDPISIDPISTHPATGRRPRRRRTWYRRRLRMQRILVAVVVGTVLAGACWQFAPSYFSALSRHESQLASGSLWTRGNVHNNLALLAGQSKPQKSFPRIANIYPYSVIPGGVKDSEDLRYAALRDYVVRRHFARFDFTHARLLRATEAREVYLSYRIRDAVYWTRRKVRLHPGELLLTDGKITARARCGNQVSDTIQPEVSNEEPDVDVLDQPVLAVAAAPSLTPRPVLAAPELPAGVPAPPQTFTGGFIFPYVPFGAPVFGGCPVGEVDKKGVCHHKPPRRVTPEPSTMLLLGSGLALIAWRYRKRLRPVAA
ncbi:MAG: PEP-CTERM sorting domain-containing protein [Terriglobales bacterium]